MASIRAEDIPQMAEELLRRNGLRMPDVQFQVTGEDHEDGALGSFNPGTKVIEIYPDGDPRTIMHEVGHAWAEQNLNKTDKARIARALGLPTWNSGDHAWQRRAAERAAEVFAFKALEGSDYVRDDHTTLDKQWRILTVPMKHRQNLEFANQSNRAGRAQVSRRVAVE